MHIEVNGLTYHCRCNCGWRLEQTVAVGKDPENVAYLHAFKHVVFHAFGAYV